MAMLSKAERGLADYTEALQWIGQQPCRMDAPGASGNCDCAETCACLTEYCLPCYARSVLKKHGKEPA